MEMIKNLIIDMYNSFDNDTIEAIEEWANDNLSNHFILTLKPNPRTYDYPGDMGDGYFDGYEYYYEAVYSEIVSELYSIAKNNGYENTKKQFEEEVANLFENKDAIYKAFPMLLTEIQYQEACDEKYCESDIEYEGFGYGEYYDD